MITTPSIGHDIYVSYIHRTYIHVHGQQHPNEIDDRNQVCAMNFVIACDAITCGLAHFLGRRNRPEFIWLLKSKVKWKIAFHVRGFRIQRPNDHLAFDFESQTHEDYRFSFGLIPQKPSELWAVLASKKMREQTRNCVACDGKIHDQSRCTLIL